MVYDLKEKGREKMIYLDNAATTFPKPPNVVDAVNRCLKNYSANPGRSGHKLSEKAAEEIFICRKNVENFFLFKTFFVSLYYAALRRR